MALRKRIPQTAVEWADQHYRLVAGSSQIKGRWITQPAQVAMLNMMGSDAIRELYIQKCARFGYTKCLVAALLYFSEHKKRDSVLYMPTDDDGKETVVDEIDPAIAEMPAMQAAFPDWCQANERNTNKKKKGIGFTLDIKGAKTPKNFRRITKQVVAGDEIDAWDIEVGREGDPIKLAKKRLDGASFPKFIGGTSPTVEGRSHIQRLMAAADVILRIYARCPHCGGEQHLQWGGKDADFGIQWDHDLPPSELTGDDVWYQCQHCPDVFFYRDLPKALERCRLIDEERGIWTADGLIFYNSANRQIPAPRKVGLYLNALYSLLLSEGWVELVREWIEAQTDPLKLKSFINLVLGQLFAEDGGSKLDHQVLFERREEYRAPVPMGGLYLTAFIDTQDDRLEGMVVAWGEEEESWTVDYWVLYGDPHRPQIWDKAEQKIRKAYIHETGLELHIRRFGIDMGGHFADEVAAFVKRFPDHFGHVCRGTNQLGKPVVHYAQKKDHRGVHLTTICPDTAKDVVYSRYLLLPAEAGKPCPGRIHNPVAEWCSESYFKQAVAETKRLEYVKGRPQYRYFLRKEGARNEVLDCYVGNLAMIRAAKQYFGLSLSGLARSLAHIDNPDQAPHRRPGTKKRRVTGGINS